MQEILNFFASNNGVAIIVALAIFIITLILVVKRLIGFVITIILLAFALISGFFVANADLFREVLKGLTNTGTPEEKDTVEQLKAQVFKAYEDIKTELKEQKEEFQKIIQKSKSPEKKVIEETPPPPQKEEESQRQVR